MSDQRVIQIVSLADGTPTAFAGQYVVEYDPSRDGTEPGTGRPMMCHLVTTPTLADATRFSRDDVFRVWKQVDHRHPEREDGLPNRPLTAFTIAVLDVGQATS